MAESQAAVSSGSNAVGEATPAQASPQTPSYTADDLKRMVKSGDPVQNRAALEYMQNPPPVAADPAPAPVEPVPQEMPATEPQAPKEPVATATPPTPTPAELKKKFKVQRAGKEIELDDPDGFLGRKSADGLKQSYAHLMPHLDELRQDNRTLRETAQSVQSKLNAAEREREEMRKQLEAARNRPAPPAVKQETQSQLDLPEPPMSPDDLPADPSSWTEEDYTKFRNWQKETSVYNRKAREALMRVAARPASVATPAPQQPSALSSEERELIEWAKNQKQEAEKDKQRQLDRQYWDGVSQFQNMHADYKTTKDVADAHQDILTFAENLAVANGLRLDPNATPDQVAAYEGTKMRLLKAYRTGNKDVVGTVESSGIDVPQDMEQYFNIAELEQKRREYVSKGILGERASLHQAWVYDMDQNGGFNSQVSNLEVTAQAKGANNVLSALEQQQQTYAHTVPNQTVQQSEAVENMPRDQINRLLSASPQEMMRDPELRKKQQEVMRAIADGKISVRR